MNFNPLEPAKFGRRRPKTAKRQENETQPFSEPTSPVREKSLPFTPVPPPPRITDDDIDTPVTTTTLTEPQQPRPPRQPRIRTGSGDIRNTEQKENAAEDKERKGFGRREQRKGSAKDTSSGTSGGWFGTSVANTGHPNRETTKDKEDETDGEGSEKITKISRSSSILSIPTLDTTELASAPALPTNRLKTIQQLDSELMASTGALVEPPTSLSGVDLSLLVGTALRPPNEVLEENVPWDWDVVWQEVKDELEGIC
ncbi:hypothetical protein HDU85_006121 [Gaertneriomyces sp. JEL0708]|nr:hypothetical protein HDU85_006121 [Gaertneriomyces sp. JEL0708]